MPRRNWRLEDAITLRAQGMTYAEIATALGVAGESTIRQALRRLNPAPPAEHRTRAARQATGIRWGRQILPTNGRTFGVEIEFHTALRGDVARAVEEVVGYHIHMTGYHGRDCVTCGQPVNGYRHWKLETDSSATAGMANAGAYPHNQGGELVSPVLQGREGLEEIKKVMKALREVNAKVDYRHGMHVHLGVADMAPEHRANLFRNYGIMQSFFYELVARGRRDNHYCKPVRLDTLHSWATESIAHVNLRGSHTDGMNVTNINRIGTIEMRLHQGTLNGTKAVNWIKLLLAFFDASDTPYQPEEPIDLIDWLKGRDKITPAEAEWYKNRRANLTGIPRNDLVTV